MKQKNRINRFVFENNDLSDAIDKLIGKYAKHGLLISENVEDYEQDILKTKRLIYGCFMRFCLISNRTEMGSKSYV